jgi:NAD(P)-dependent dehydrogenase (short-subunit alcohol dehydrogenase family)
VIINIADLAAFESWPLRAARDGQGSGGAHDRALARQLAQTIRVNAIAPGVVLLPEGMSTERPIAWPGPPRYGVTGNRTMWRGPWSISSMPPLSPAKYFWWTADGT